MTEKDHVIQINMFGGFSITMDGNTIADQNNHSKKPWVLLQYIATFRDRDIPNEELIDLFWNEDNSTNPNGALKTLMFRVRRIIEPLGMPPQLLILQKHKAYGWNRSLKTVTDTEIFEGLYLKAMAKGLNEEEQLKYCLQAVDIYKGKYLPNSEWESWTNPISAYYHNLYQKLVSKALAALDKQKDYPSIIDICQKTIAIDPYGEDAHYYLIYALYQSGNQFMAMKHYQHVSNMFYDEFAITPSARFKDLYKLIRDKKHGVVTDLSVIRDSLMEGSCGAGAFCCEPSVFKDIYQLETRAIGRTGDSIFLCLITISDLKGELLKPAVQTRAMDQLGDSIRSSLRRGDVYSRYSVSQYLMLLPTATYENAEMVLKRIVQNFKKSYSKKDLIITYSLQSIIPA